jgi:hypothetical protein
MRRTFRFLVLLCFFAPAVASTQPWWSVGPKLGYTLGDNGGFTWGFEVTYFPQRIFPWWGYTLDFTSWKEHSSLHLGIEGNEGIGLDIGPTLFYLNGVVNLGVSAIPFLGAFLFGYYEFAWPFFQAPFQTWGGYLKIPIGLPLNGFGP